MSKDLNAILAFAQQIVEAGPKLPELESLDARLIEVRKSLQSAESNHRLVQQSITDKTQELAELDGRLRTKTDAILSGAQVKADAIVEEANRRAKEIVTSAQSAITDTTTEANAKAKELDGLKAQINEAQKNMHELRQLARKIA